MKLSKEQARSHKQACELLEKEVLTTEDKLFVLENWNEGAEHVNSTAGAFFTPIGLAKDFQLAVSRYGRVVDLCAGIGSLSFHLIQQCAWSNSGNQLKELVCVELNPNYVKVGKKIVPEATWILGSVLDLELLRQLGKFDQAISNPPFGNVKSGHGFELNGLSYKGAEFEFKVIEIASRIADYGAFILPQMSTPWKYSGSNRMESSSSAKVEKFIEKTGIEFEFNCGIDTSIYLDDWKGVKPMCEIALFDFTGLNKQLNLF